MTQSFVSSFNLIDDILDFAKKNPDVEFIFKTKKYLSEKLLSNYITKDSNFLNTSSIHLEELVLKYSS